MKIGNRVKTMHGTGVIVGKDLPELTCWRWVVRIDEPLPEFDAMVKRFQNQELAYFPNEVTL